MKSVFSLVSVAFAAFFLFPFNSRAACAGTAEYAKSDSLKVVAALEILRPMSEAGAAMPEMLVACAKRFLCTPYVAGILEKTPERLIVNAGETDCILFVEMCLSLCLTARDGGDFAAYCDNVRNLRYRDGVVDGYASRLHYTSEWIRQAQGRGVLMEVTSKIGGRAYPQTFSFMSKHTSSYKQLASGDAAAKKELGRIMAAEQSLSSDDYWLLRKEDLPAHISEIKDGDIICFNTTVAGLDIAHVAIAYHDKGKLTFIHASSTAGKVIVNPAPLSGYLSSRKSINGIRVLRVR